MELDNKDLETPLTPPLLEDEALAVGEATELEAAEVLGHERSPAFTSPRSGS